MLLDLKVRFYPPSLTKTFTFPYFSTLWKKSEKAPANQVNFLIINNFYFLHFCSAGKKSSFEPLRLNNLTT